MTSHNVYMFFGIYFENREGQNEHAFDELELIENEFDLIIDNDNNNYFYVGKIIGSIDVFVRGESAANRMPDNPEIQDVGARLMNRFPGMATLFYMINHYET